MNPIKHDYKGITINQRSEDGYINLNEMAQATGKRVDNWLQNKSTQELITEFDLEVSYNSASTTLNSSKLKQALLTYEGNKGGTWAHPDIAIQFAQWCSPSFALQVSRWVRDWLTGANAFSQMDDDHLARVELLADISKLDATISSSQAKREKKLRDLQWLDEQIKHKQLAIEMGEIIDESDRNK